ncbi:MAG: RimK-like ATPgrasp N-terminal domain-containing protein [Planctomycetota bacterium]|nr:RimK-like ATPgrasp N-terminal domain-containing protein [Planctomycetota bacterium]MDW8372993.1 RimK-like ATPgrasp N-terminal domain-containing protein [Planctomycetota bacterium]
MREPQFPSAPLPADLSADDVFVNLAGDYSYLSDGYYRSMEAEHEGLRPIPTCEEALDAYVVPLALTKARAAGIKTPEWEIANDTTTTIRPPLIAYPINPFQDEGQVIADIASLAKAIKSLTMTGKYAVVCQKMPPDSRIDTLRLVLGRCTKPEFAQLARQLWETFHLPLARVRIIVTERDYLFSAIQPLPEDELTLGEQAFVKEAGLWRA